MSSVELPSEHSREGRIGLNRRLPGLVVATTGTLAELTLTENNKKKQRSVIILPPINTSSYNILSDASADESVTTPQTAFRTPNAKRKDAITPPASSQPPKRRTTTPIPGTNAFLVSPEHKLILKHYTKLHKEIKCAKCNTANSITQNGHTKHVPHRPQFKCTKCKKTIQIAEMQELVNTCTEMTAEHNPLYFSEEESQGQFDSEMELTEPQSTDAEITSAYTTDNEETYQQPQLQQPEQSSINTLIARLETVETQLEQHSQNFEIIHKLQTENETLKKENKRLQKIVDDLLTKNNEKMNEKITKKIKNARDTDSSHKKNDTERNSIQKNEKNTQNNTNDTNTDTENTNPPNSRPPKPSYASIASRLTNNEPKPSFYRGQKTNPTQQKVAKRAFTGKTINNKFTHMYLETNSRKKPSKIRENLAKAGIDNVRVLDVYNPDWNVVALLMHEDYVTEVTNIFNQQEISIIEYNHLDPTHLRDRNYADQSMDFKINKLKEIRNNNMMRALSFIRLPVRNSVARSFANQNLITEDQLIQILQDSRDTQNHNSNSYFVKKNNSKEQQQEDMVMEEEEQQKIEADRSYEEDHHQKESSCHNTQQQQPDTNSTGDTTKSTQLLL
ncbi:hypothetical protein G6F42_008372 [Rhizopus arrhizus]|nr:hypothetical protein G6F42_008372 [Rhizopus arrhizus]